MKDQRIPGTLGGERLYELLRLLQLGAVVRDRDDVAPRLDAAELALGGDEVAAEAVLARDDARRDEQRAQELADELRCAQVRASERRRGEWRAERVERV